MFVAELGMRVMSCRARGVRSYWNAFDLVLILVGIFRILLCIPGRDIGLHIRIIRHKIIIIITIVSGLRVIQSLFDEIFSRYYFLRESWARRLGGVRTGWVTESAGS